MPRQDLNKLLCEHERVGSSKGFSDHRHDSRYNDMYERRAVDAYQPDPEVDGFSPLAGGCYREGMKRRYDTWNDRKSFGENLSPLYGFVRKNVGRKWDDVYSELTDVFDTRSVINQHILLHLFQYVETKLFVNAAGQVCYGEGRYYGDVLEKDTFWRGEQHYVHPVTGILSVFYGQSYGSRNRGYREAREAEKAKTCRKIDDSTDAKLINGMWYSCGHKPWEQTIRYGMGFDPFCVVAGRRVTKRDAEGKVYVSKRTMSKKELKQHNLSNVLVV